MITLPRPDGTLEGYVPGAPSPWPRTAAPSRTRRAFAAAHVVADPLATHDPWLEPAVDWDATLAYRPEFWRSYASR